MPGAARENAPEGARPASNASRRAFTLLHAWGAYGHRWPVVDQQLGGRRRRSFACSGRLASISMVNEGEIDARITRITRQRFRARFHVRGRDRAIVDLRGMPTIRRHAADLVDQRLAPAEPHKDGRQTPYRGHPVFVAQHATATCCRTCLERWHGIPKGRELHPAEREYVVEVVCRWIGRDTGASA